MPITGPGRLSKIGVSDVNRVVVSSRHRQVRWLQTVLGASVWLSCLWAACAADVLQPAGNLARPSARVFSATADIRALSQAEAARGYPVRLHAVVTYYDPGTECFVQDATGGIWVDVQSDGDLHLDPGQWVEVRGFTGKGLAANQVVKPTITVLGLASLPKPQSPRYEEFASGKMVTEWIKMEGVVHSAQFDSDSKNLVLSLVVGGDSIRVEVHHYPEHARQELLDARIQVRGACGIISNSKQQMIGIVLYTPAYSFIRIQERGVPEAGIPYVESISDLMRLTPKTTSGHRVKVRGVVTLGAPYRFLYIADKTDSILMETAGQENVQPGDTVETVAFPVVGKGAPRLEEASLHKLAPGSRPAPVAIDVAQAMDGQFDRALVQIEGRVFELATEDRLPTLIMESGKVAFQALVLGAEAPTALAGMRVGSLVRVTGICQVQTDQEGNPRTFRILASCPADVVVLQQGPWWNTARAGVVLVLMGVIVLVAAGWVPMLRRQVNRQARLLRKEAAAQVAMAKRFEFVARVTNDALWEVDLAARTLWTSPVYAMLYGVLPSMFPEDPRVLLARVCPSDQEAVWASIVAALHSPAIKWENECRLRRSDDSYADVYVRAYIERDDTGGALRLIGAVTDITARKRAEDALAEEAARRQMLVEQSKDGVVVLDKDGNVYDANRSFAEMLMYTPEEVRKLRIQDWNSCWKQQEMAEDTSAPPCRGRTFETRYRCKDGSFLEVEVSTSCTDQGGGAYHFCVVRDISGRKKTENALRLQAAALEAAANGIVITDPSGTILWANPGFATLTGYTVNEVIGKTPRVLKSGEHDQAFYRELWETIRAGKAWQGEMLNRRKDGSSYIEAMTITPVCDEAGKITNYIAIKQDITRRRQAEEELRRAEKALRESERRYRTLFENAPIGIYRTTPDGRILAGNPAFVQMFGYARFEDLAARNLNAEGFEPEYNRRRFRQLLEKYGQIAGLEADWHRRDGSTVRVRENVRAIHDDAGEVVCYEGTAEDITERRRAEQKIAQLAAIVEASDDAIVSMTLDGIILSWNRGAARTYGYDEKEMIGKPIAVLIPPHVPDDTSQIRARIEGGEHIEHYETLRRRKDGQLIHVSRTISPIRDGEGTVVAVSSIARDVSATKRVEAELRAALARLAEGVAKRTRAEAEVAALSHRLINAQEEERTRLARELHDDVSQQIAVLGIGLSNIKRYIPPRRKEGHEEAARAFLRLRQLAEDIRRLSHQLHPAVLEHSGLLAALKSYSREFEQVTGVAALVRARGRLDDLPPQPALGVLRIAQEALQNVWKHSGTKQVNIYLTRSPKHMRLRISDRGAGFDLTEVHKGEGLGLVSMRERAKLLGGTFEIDSTPGQGTTIIATIPFADVPTAALQEHTSEVAAASDA